MSAATGENQEPGAENLETRVSGSWFSVHSSTIHLSRADWNVLRWLLPLALLHGLLFLMLMPPWQHYDEPAHFLYAAEIAAGELNNPGEASVAIRREIVDSMYRFRFYDPGVRPNLLINTPLSVGEDQRVHPPFYYTLVAQPLRFMRYLGVEQQLYVARSLSLFFYVLTIVAAWRVAVIALDDEPLMQIVLPLLLVLNPTFADLMSAVNSDVLVNMAVTVSLLGAVLLVRDGLRPTGLALALLGIGVALMTKRTALPAGIPLALALFWAIRRRPLTWWVGLLGLTWVLGLLSIAGLQLTSISGDSGTHTVLVARPWLITLDETYLRLDLDAWIRSLSDSERIGMRYYGLVIVGFTSFWARFAWGNIAPEAVWDWALLALSGIAIAGMIQGSIRFASALPLWQRRCIWIFTLAVAVAWLSLYARLHPLPEDPTARIYYPTGRYMFWAMLPSVWLLTLGIQWISPARWRSYTPLGLLLFFSLFDLAVLTITVIGYYYR